MKYAFFPGCVLKGAAAEAYTSMQKVCEKIGIELVEIENWTCCGASHAQGVNDLAALAVNARNISIAEHMGLPIMTVCNTCTLQLRTAKHRLDSDEKLKEKVKYKQGKFLNDDKKENEIFILQQENSNLKGEIKKLEKKIKEYKDINIRIFDSPNKSMNLNLSKYSNSNQIINNNIIINSYHKKYPSLNTKQKSKDKNNILNTSYSYSNKKPFKKKGNNMNKTNKTMNLFFKDKTKNRVIKNV